MTITEKKLRVSSLRTYLVDQIKEHGPMDMYTYMKTCLTHPEYGYYAKKDPDRIFGSFGDFITSPEISPLFAEMIALWLMTQWQRLDSPNVLNLLELGPGRGDLMCGILKTLKSFKSFEADITVHFVEVNSHLQNIQTDKCREYATIFHHQDLSFLSTLNTPTVVIANEFFDALPTQQYVELEGRHYVSAVDVCAECVLKKVQMPYLGDLPMQKEVQPELLKILEKIYQHLQEYGGAALVVDYGYWEGSGYTLQAVYKHKYVDVLDFPGDSDLSVHVNFQDMALQSTNYQLRYVYQTQREFLLDHGIQLRLQQLCEGVNDTSLNKELYEGVNRLIAPGDMGHLFKVLQILG